MDYSGTRINCRKFPLIVLWILHSATLTVALGSIEDANLWLGGYAVETRGNCLSWYPSPSPKVQKTSTSFVQLLSSEKFMHDTSTTHPHTISHNHPQQVLPSHCLAAYQSAFKLLKPLRLTVKRTAHAVFCECTHLLNAETAIACHDFNVWKLSTFKPLI